MGLVYNDYLSSDKIYGCKNCKTHLSKHESLVSRVRSPLLPSPPPTPQPNQGRHKLTPPPRASAAK